MPAMIRSSVNGGIHREKAQDTSCNPDSVMRNIYTRPLNFFSAKNMVPLTNYYGNGTNIGLMAKSGGITGNMNKTFGKLKPTVRFSVLTLIPGKILVEATM